jgi:hypothetical protein
MIIITTGISYIYTAVDGFFKAWQASENIKKDYPLWTIPSFGVFVSLSNLTLTGCSPAEPVSVSI